MISAKSWMARGLAVALSLPAVSVVGAGAGCGGGEEPAAAKPEKKVDPAVMRRRKEIEDNIGVISNALSKDPLNVERTVSDCERYAREATEVGAADLAKKLMDMKKEARETFEREAEKATKDACAGARQYAAAGDTKKARNRLAGLHTNVQKDERYLALINAALDDVMKVERAERYYERVTKAKYESFKARNDWERAQGLLEAFLTIPAFKESPYKKEVETALAAAQPEADKVRTARVKEKKIRWIPCFNGAEKDLFEWEIDDSESCKVSESVLTFRHNDEERQTLYITYGKDTWEDYVIEVDVRLDKGSFYVNARGTMEGEGDEKSRNWQPGPQITESELGDRSRWYKIRFEVRGGEMRWLLPGAGAHSTKRLKYQRGPFQVRIPKGTVVSFKRIWVQLIKPAEGGEE